MIEFKTPKKKPYTSNIKLLIKWTVGPNPIEETQNLKILIELNYHLFLFTIGHLLLCKSMHQLAYIISRSI